MWHGGTSFSDIVSDRYEDANIAFPPPSTAWMQAGQRRCWTSGLSEELTFENKSEGWTASMWTASTERSWDPFGHLERLSASS